MWTLLWPLLALGTSAAAWNRRRPWVIILICAPMVLAALSAVPAFVSMVHSSPAERAVAVSTGISELMNSFAFALIVSISLAIVAGLTAGVRAALDRR